MTYSEYETSVAKYLVAHNPDFAVRYNQRVLGIYSKIERQIDVLLNDTRGADRIVVECKYYNRAVDIGIIEAFISFLKDVGILDGILITNKGISRAATRRVALAPIRLRVLTEKDLEKYAIKGLMPHEDDRMALLKEPNGWVISTIIFDLKACCVLMPIGYSYKQSIDDGNFLYVNLRKDCTDLKIHIENEKKEIDKFYPGKNTHRVYVEKPLVVRKSYLSDRNRFDVGVFAAFTNGLIMVHGLVKKQDIGWTIKSIHKALVGASLFNIKVESVTNDQIVINIPDNR